MRVHHPIRHGSDPLPYLQVRTENISFQNWLTFLPCRLRLKRKQEREERRRRRRGRDSSGLDCGHELDDTSSMEDSVVQDGLGQPGIAPPPPPRSSHWYSLAWWKPASPHDILAAHRPPPTYDDALTHQVPATTDIQPPRSAGRAIAEPAESPSLSSASNASEAPPYSEIHLDPVIRDYDVWAQPPNVAALHREAVAALGSQSNRPALCGAAMVLPPGPPPAHSTLHHIRSPQESPPEPAPESNASTSSFQPRVVLSAARRRPGRREVASDGCARLAAVNSSASALHHVVGVPTLPRRLRRLRARSREGVAMRSSSSGEGSTATLHRFSLQLDLPPRSTPHPDYDVDSSATYGTPERV